MCMTGDDACAEKLKQIERTIWIDRIIIGVYKFVWPCLWKDVHGYTLCALTTKALARRAFSSSLSAVSHLKYCKICNLKYIKLCKTDSNIIFFTQTLSFLFVIQMTKKKMIEKCRTQLNKSSANNKVSMISHLVREVAHFSIGN